MGVGGIAVNNKFYAYMGQGTRKFVRYDESAGTNDSSRWKDLGLNISGGGTIAQTTYAPTVFSFFDSSIYVLGGNAYNGCYKYDLTQTEGSGTWETIPSQLKNWVGKKEWYALVSLSLYIVEIIHIKTYMYLI